MANKRYKPTTQMPELPEILGPTELSLFDQVSNDINLFNMVDDEVIRLSGSELLYYKYMRGEEDFDEVYMETRAKTIASEPIRLMGHYDPTVLEQGLDEFGLSVSNDQEFTFNKTYIERILRRAPIEGDVIKPVFQDQRYAIHQVQVEGFEIYGVYHYRCSANLLRDSEEVLDEPIERPDDLGGDLGL